LVLDRPLLLLRLRVLPPELRPTRPLPRERVRVRPTLPLLPLERVRRFTLPLRPLERVRRRPTVPLLRPLFRALRRTPCLFPLLVRRALLVRWLIPARSPILETPMPLVRSGVLLLS